MIPNWPLYFWSNGDITTTPHTPTTAEPVVLIAVLKPLR